MGLIPLEIWDAELQNGDTLWDHQNRDDLPDCLFEVVHSLSNGTACSKSCGPIVSGKQSLDAIYVCGGRALDSEILEPLLKFGIPVVPAEELVFGAMPGGLHLLQKHGLAGPVVDVGQSQIKFEYWGERWIVPRDQLRFPMSNKIPQEQHSEYSKRLAKTIAKELRIRNNGATGLTLALPCEISADLRLGGCSYPGFDGASTFFDELAARLGINIILLMNDAELVACSASLDSRLPRPGRILILTLGFGVGGAILETAL